MGIPTIASGSVLAAQSDGNFGRAQPSPTGGTVVAQTPAPAMAAIQAPASERVSQAVKQVNDAFAKNAQSLSVSFVKDTATGIDVVELTDTSTNKVISQFPPKAIIAMAESLDQFQATKGQLLNASA